jgi:Fe-S cluster biogenesis protein NfuA/nitrite reductase/ring-hydroxylating ferredoxin subunit
MDNQEARKLAERVDALLDEVEASAPPALTRRVEDLVRAIVGLYGAGLERAIELAAEDPAAVRRLADDDLVGSLMVLHDLHPDDVETRVQAALDRVRPYLGSHAGGVSLTGVDADGVAHLQLEGSCDGCPSSAMTVQNAIEDAILSAAPDVVAVSVQGVVAPDPPLLQIQPFAALREGGDAGWVHVDVDVPPGAVSLALAAGEPFLVARVPASAGAPETLLAYRTRCPHCGSELADGLLTGEVLKCRGCGHRFDLRLAGRSADGDLAERLVPVPLLPDGDGWRVSLPERVAT